MVFARPLGRFTGLGGGALVPMRFSNDSTSLARILKRGCFPWEKLRARSLRSLMYPITFQSPTRHFFASSGGVKLSFVAVSAIAARSRTGTVQHGSRDRNNQRLNFFPLETDRPIG